MPQTSAIWPSRNQKNDTSSINSKRRPVRRMPEPFAGMGRRAGEATNYGIALGNQLDNLHLSVRERGQEGCKHYVSRARRVTFAMSEGSSL